MVAPRIQRMPIRRRLRIPAISLFSSGFVSGRPSSFPPLISLPVSPVPVCFSDNLTAGMLARVIGESQFHPPRPPTVTSLCDAESMGEV
ncbi:hypothetical protein C8R45DRAFT_971744 [Mycena sanguinolenta]|nr:hypothetical protein C8R45DRAFT_971744 [Mycena sanguinolenta]